MKTIAIQRSAVEALLNRARSGILLSAACPGMVRDAFDFWQGSANTCHALLQGSGHRLAEKDATLGGYKTYSFLQAAAIALGDDFDRLTRAEIAQRLVAAGFQIPLHTVANTDAETAVQLVDGAVCVIDLHSEQAIVRVDFDDGSGGLHGSPFVEPAIVREGGAV